MSLLLYFCGSASCGHPASNLTRRCLQDKTFRSTIENSRNDRQGITTRTSADQRSPNSKAPGTGKSLHPQVYGVSLADPVTGAEKFRPNATQQNSPQICEPTYEKLRSALGVSPGTIRPKLRPGRTPARRCADGEPECRRACRPQPGQERSHQTSAPRPVHDQRPSQGAHFRAWPTS